MDGQGTVVRDPDKTLYNENEEVQLTPNPDSGWEFFNWTGDETSTSNPVTIIMNENKTITATFIDTSETTDYLEDVDSGTTSPTGDYRWMDIANQEYSESYRDTYNYTNATVEISYFPVDETLSGTLTATNLKPNFAYQLKLVGTPGTPENEQLGLVGRWWQEEWDGAQWTNGWNLNNKGNGSSPNPNDLNYTARRNITDGTSPTGLHYRYTGYLLFDYFTTDGYGNATLSFETGSCYHVLWKTTQRTHTGDDGPIITTTFTANTSSPAYDVNYSEQTVDIFGEWERLPMGNVPLSTGSYTAQLMITEESFHGTGENEGSWAAAMGTDISFIIQDI